MAGENKNLNDTLAQLVNSGVNWSEFKLEGTGTTQNKKVTVSIEVEEIPDGEE